MGPAQPCWVHSAACCSMLFSVVLTFLGLTCVTFFIGRVIPIDPVLAIVGRQGVERDL